jgi:nucleoside phosphorylase
MSRRPYHDEEPDRIRPERPETWDVSSAFLTSDDYTIAWICALPLELGASRALLDEEHPPLPALPGDDNKYILGRVDQHNVVMACLPGQYGTKNAAVVATNLKRSFLKIRATLMVGIGGGAPDGTNDLRLGDVVVGTRVMQYDMGKNIGEGVFQMTADPTIPSRLLFAAVSTLRSIPTQDASSARVTALLQTKLATHVRPNEPDQLFQASYQHPFNAPTCHGCDPSRLEQRRVRAVNEPRIHYGGIASANTVMKNARARDDIARELSIMCFEMEAAGIMDNQCLPIRGICDYSDSHKNKAWQRYAAAAAAAYARELLEALPQTLEERTRAQTWLGTSSDHATGM